MKGAHLTILFFIAIWTSARPTEVEYEDCGSEAAVKSVEVSPCDNPAMCTIYVGSVVSASITFVPANDINRLKLKTYAVFGNKTVPLPITDDDACKNSGLVCPLKSGSTAVFQKQISIPSSVPEIMATLQTEFRDQKNKKVVCVQNSIRIKRP